MTVLRLSPYKSESDRDSWANFYWGTVTDLEEKMGVYSIKTMATKDLIQLLDSRLVAYNAKFTMSANECITGIEFATEEDFTAFKLTF